MINWAYIAGFFDGEGNIYVGNKCISVNISQKRTIILNEIQSFLLQHGIKCGIDHKSNSTGGVGVLRINNRKDALIFLNNIIPFLHVKRTEAQDFIRYFKLFPIAHIHNFCKINHLGQIRIGITKRVYMNDFLIA